MALLADIGLVIRDSAIVVGGVAAVITGVGVIAKSKVGHLFRWLYRRLFGEPVGEWLKQHFRSVIDERLSANSYVEKKDFQEFIRVNSEQHGEVRSLAEGIQESVEDIQKSVRPFEGQIKAVFGRLGELRDDHDETRAISVEARTAAEQARADAEQARADAREALRLAREHQHRDP